MSANITERCIIFGTALYVYTRLIRAFATSEIGKIEGLNLIILSIWTWCTHSIGSPVSNKDEKISHKLWGTDEKCYRSHVPSEMTIFQLALILGMFLIGFTLSSLLLHSRYLAQIPKWKKKCVENIENKKKWVAILIYCGQSTLLSLNTKRKYFHGLAMIMFIPGCLYEPKFMHLAFSVAFAALIFLEYLRYFAVYPFGKQLHLFLNEFLDHRDSGPIITSHLYLLIGCAGCIWLKGLVEFNPCKSFGYIDVRPWRFYVIGRRYGCHKWPGTSKTVEGFVAFIFFQLLGVFVLSKFWMADNMWPKNENWTTYTIKVSLSGWRLKGRHVLIIGGNHIIANRIEFILDTKPEKITLISPKQKITSNKVTSYINNDLVIYKNKEFHVDDLTTEKIDLILASIDNDLKLSEKIAATAREQKIPINVAELPQLCNFWFMPTYRDGNLQVAISTNGTVPHVAQKLRQHIIENLPKNISNAIGNAALLKQLVGTANISTLRKIADKLSLNQLAQLSEPEIKKLIGTNESNDNDLISISKSILSLKSKIGIEINAHEGGGLKLVNGSTAIEHVAYALTSSIFIYPATRSYYLGELSLYWSSQSLNNAFGEINHVIKADTRFGASTMVFGAASNVKRISAFASSQSIIPMIPNFYGIVDEKIPFVIHVSALDNDDQMNYYVNYHNLLIAHETGFGIINSYSIQEAHDIALITHLASVYLKTPFLHVFDGLKVLNESTKINLLSYSNILRLNKELLNMTENLKSFDENNDDDK
ncbi:6679_t:CDS:10, partial [Entrophospora sp. SA101]